MTDITNAERRAIFTEGAWILHSRYNSFTPYLETREYVEKEALRRYPDSYEPTTVTMETGHQYRIHDGHVDFRPAPNEDWYHGGGFTVADCAALGQIAHEYYERTK